MKNGRFSALVHTLALAVALGVSAVTVTPTLAQAATTITYQFDGGGWGHGIGLSQYGALGYATRSKDPMTYDRILSHYYQGTKLVVPATSPNPTVRVNLASSAGARSSWRIQSGTGTTLTIDSVAYSADKVQLSGKKSYWIKVESGDVKVYNDVTYVSDGVTKHKSGTLVRSFPGKVVLQSSSSRVTRTGTWETKSSTSASGGSYLRSSTKGNELSIKFEGTSVKLFGMKSPGSGKADVYLDGVRQETVDLYRSSTAYKQSLFARDKLTSGAHTIKLKVLGTKRTESTGTSVNLDGIDLFEGVRAASGGRVMIATTSGPYDHTGIRWRGTIRFVPYEPTTSKAINYVDIESYLYGVVPRESISSWHIEALKAQSVAARSYAYQDAKDGRAIYCTVYSQVYGGESRGTTRHETDSTTKAVNATRGQVVWYEDETKPVKTFFFSSSGGHTANVEDVWGSSPKPYYTGVVDLDNASPHYKWTVGPMSASSLSSKVRAKLSTPVPSDATIVAMSLDRASSGHVRTATVTWSNGAKSTLRGDVMRSALGMRSSKFDVLARVEAPGSALETSGTWKTSYVTGSSGGTHVVTNKPGAWLKVKFSGTSISWIGAKYRGYGTAEVRLDGTKVATVDLYNATTIYQQKLYTKTGLTSGPHTLEIRATGKKNAASSGAYVPVDAFDIRRGGLSR